MDANNLPMGGYIRVSVVGGRGGDTFMSPDLQRDSIQAWATRAGAQLKVVREELDVSGGTRNRPGLEWLVEETQAGRLGGIVVAKIDRFTRNVAYGADVIERVVAAGGTVIGADDGTDARTRNGRLMVQMMMAIGEHQLEGYREGTRAAQAKMIAQGKHVGPYPPAGYVRPGGYLQPDPVWAPRITEAFRRLASGQSLTEVASWLNDLGLTTGRGGRITAQWLAATVKNRAYLGEVSHGEHRNVDAHEPLIDEFAFRRAGGKRRPRTPSHGGVLLSGLVRCAGCGYVMVRNTTPPYADGRRRALWACAKNRPSGVCPSPATAMEEKLEPMVLDAFWERVTAMEARRTEDDGDEVTLIAAVSKARSELAAFRDQEGIIDALGMPGYLEGLRTRQGRLATATSALENHHATRTPAAFAVADLQAVWDELSVGERRAAISREFAAIVVQRPAVFRSHSEPLSSRAAILLAGWEPDTLPRTGRSGEIVGLRLHDPPTAWLALG